MYIFLFTGPDGRVAVSSAQASEENAQIFVMNNYFGIGLDADLCYAFHTEREHKPHKFNSRLHNKGVYLKVGLQKMVGRGLNKDLSKEIYLEVDGRPVDLPSIKGIIILNIMRLVYLLVSRHITLLIRTYIFRVPYCNYTILHYILL